MNSFLQSIAFRFLVIWQRIKRFFASARFHISSWWAFVSSGGRWRGGTYGPTRGKSAPSLNAPPMEMVKPLATRILQVYGTVKNVESDQSGTHVDESLVPHWMDMTSIFHTVMGDATKNQAAPRPDIFISSLASVNSATLIEVGKLLVSYKSGMTSHTVCYYDDGFSSAPLEGGEIVFPPSVKSNVQTTTATMSNAIELVKLSTLDQDAIDNEETNSDPLSGPQIGADVVVTSYFKQFSGPAHDFYEGAPYATRPVDIYHALILFHIISPTADAPFRNFFVTLKNGQKISIPATSTEFVCDALRYHM